MSGGAMTTAADGDIWAAPMPMNPAGERRTIGNPHEITIYSGSEHKDLAAEFIRHVIFDPEITTEYFLASAQLSTGSLPLLTSGAMGEDAYTQIFVEALPHTVDNPIKSPKFYAVMDDLVVALQAIIQGGEIEAELADAQRKAERTMSR
jgi:maltose-binding protein MalE